MQDHHQSLTAAGGGFPQLKIQFPEHEQLRCPRCDSANTKFCYYNNYNLSQPRHFCKNCRRYWTKGGTLRNIPVGGGCRKSNKRPAPTPTPASAASSSSKQQHQQESLVQTPSASSILKTEPGPILEGNSVGTGSDVGKEGYTITSSLLGLGPHGQFGSFIHGSGQNTGLEMLQGSGSSSLSEGFIINGLQNGSDTSCWTSNNNNNNNNNGWPDLSINTSSGFKLQ